MVTARLWPLPARIRLCRPKLTRSGQGIKFSALSYSERTSMTLTAVVRWVRTTGRTPAVPRDDQSSHGTATCWASQNRMKHMSYHVDPMFSVLLSSHVSWAETQRLGHVGHPKSRELQNFMSVNKRTNLSLWAKLERRQRASHPKRPPGHTAQAWGFSVPSWGDGGAEKKGSKSIQKLRSSMIQHIRQGWVLEVVGVSWEPHINIYYTLIYSA